MSNYGKFLKKKPVTLKYTQRQYVQLANVVTQAVEALATATAKDIAALRIKLEVSALADLAARLNKKQLYTSQGHIRFTFSHTEALAFLVMFTNESARKWINCPLHLSTINKTLVELHKHYV